MFHMHSGHRFLLDICIVNIFSQSVFCFFIFLIEFFWRNFQFIIFPIVVSVLLWPVKKKDSCLSQGCKDFLLFSSRNFKYLVLCFVLWSVLSLISCMVFGRAWFYWIFIPVVPDLFVENITFSLIVLSWKFYLKSMYLIYLGLIFDFLSSSINICASFYPNSKLFW